MIIANFYSATYVNWGVSRQFSILRRNNLLSSLVWATFMALFKPFVESRSSSISFSVFASSCKHWKQIYSIWIYSKFDFVYFVALSNLTRSNSISNCRKTSCVSFTFSSSATSTRVAWLRRSLIKSAYNLFKVDLRSVDFRMAVSLAFKPSCVKFS